MIKTVNSVTGTGFYEDDKNENLQISTRKGDIICGRNMGQNESKNIKTVID